MRRVGGNSARRACRQGLGFRHIPRVTHSDEERALHYGHILVRWMRMWLDLVAVGHRQLNRERPCLPGIAGHDSHLRARGKRGRGRPPLEVRRLGWGLAVRDHGAKREQAGNEGRNGATHGGPPAMVWVSSTRYSRPDSPRRPVGRPNHGANSGTRVIGVPRGMCAGIWLTWRATVHLWVSERLRLQSGSAENGQASPALYNAVSLLHARSAAALL